MRIQFQAEGGIAHFPGLSQPVTIDTVNLPKAEAAELRRLVDAAQLFELPASARSRRGAADYRQYTITVEQDDRRHTVRLSDPIEGQALQALVDYLSRKASQLRRSGEGSADS
jgi:emfourin